MSLVPAPRPALDDHPCISGCSRDHREDEPGTRLCETDPIEVAVGTEQIGVEAQLYAFVDRCLVDDAELVLAGNLPRIVLDGPGLMTLTPKRARRLVRAITDLLYLVEALDGPT